MAPGGHHPGLPSLASVRVVELGAWVTAPAAAGILAEWGADVIKVEPPSGDPSRALYQSLGSSVTENPTFAFDNRGKRSVVLDLAEEADRRRLDDLLGSADVFITNVRPGALDRLGRDRGRLPPAGRHLLRGLGPGHPGRVRTGAGR